MKIIFLFKFISKLSMSLEVRACTKQERGDRMTKKVSIPSQTQCYFFTPEVISF